MPNRNAYLAVELRVLLVVMTLCVNVDITTANVCAKFSHAATAPTPETVCGQALPKGSHLNFNYVTTSSTFEAVTNTPFAINAARLMGSRVSFKMFYSNRFPELLGDRFGVCALKQFSYPAHAEALKFIECVSELFRITRVAKLQSSPPTDCLGKSIQQTMLCISAELESSSKKFYNSHNGIQKCADPKSSPLDWTALSSCAHTNEGAILLKENQEAGQKMLLDHLAYNAEKKSGAFGQGSILSNLAGGGRRLLHTGRGKERLPAAPSHGLHKPATNLIFGKSQKFIFHGAKMNCSEYVQFMCDRLIQQEPADIAHSAQWTWIAGLAIGISALLAGVGVAVLYHQERHWMKPDAFEREGPPASENAWQLLKLDENGNVDEVEEKKLRDPATKPNLPYLTAPWAAGAHKKWL